MEILQLHSVCKLSGYPADEILQRLLLSPILNKQSLLLYCLNIPVLKTALLIIALKDTLTQQVMEIFSCI